MLISIVGKSASGKTSLAKYLESLDDRMLHVDIDQISHYVLTIEKVRKNLIEKFGEKILSQEKINRKLLGKIVFENPEAMDKLTEITWPSMEEIIDQIIDTNKDKIIILDWLLLPKTKYFEKSNLRIWVDAPQTERVERALARARNNEHLTREYFMKRDEAGIDYEDGKYDVFIENRNRKESERKVNKIYEKCIVSRKF